VVMEATAGPTAARPNRQLTAFGAFEPGTAAGTQRRDSDPDAPRAVAVGVVERTPS